MAGLDDFRQANPAYQNVPDAQLADALYKKYYANQMSRQDFDIKLGLGGTDAAAPPRDIGEIAQEAFARTAGYPSRQPGLAGPVTALRQDAENQLLGGMQKTSPYPTMYGDPIGEIVQTDSGLEIKMPDGSLVPWQMKGPDGEFLVQGMEGVQALRNPEDGKFYAYRGTQETDESAASALARIAGPGMLAGPVTGAIGPAAQGLSSTLEKFSAQGVRPNLATATNSRAAQVLHNTLKDFFPSAGVVQRADALQESDALNALRRVAGGYGSADTPIDAGRAIQRGAESFIAQGPVPTMTPGEIIIAPTRVTGFNNKAETVYSRVDSLLPPETVVPFTETTGALGAVSQRFENKALGELFQNPTLKKWAETLRASNTGELSWADAQAFRSEVGKMLRRPQLVSDVDTAQLKSIYAAISRDMEKAAETAGGPAAATAWRRANDYYRAGLERINGALSSVLKVKSEEQAYRKLLGMMQSGGATESASAINAIRKSLPEEAWGDVASTLIQRMGDPVPSAMAFADDVANFAPSTFIRNYAKLSDSAKDALFGGSGRGALRSALDDMVEIAGRMSATEKLTNRPRTAGQVGSFGLAGMAFYDPVFALLAAAGSNIGARAITSPTFVRWLSRIPASTQAPVNLTSEVARLNQLARLDPSLREVAAALSAALADQNRGQ